MPILPPALTLIAGGIVVSGLHEVSPFLKAGIEPGDVIVAVDGQPVNTPAEMIFRMSVAGLGETVSVTAFRGRESFETEVALMAAPDRPGRERRALDKRSVLPGLAVSNINPAVLAEYGLPLGSSGVVVEDPGSFGAQVGLRKGDILQGINGETVETTGDVEKALSGRVRVLAFDVQRGLQRLVIRFRL